MRAPVSVIIPTLNAKEALPACLAALFEGIQAGLIRELIISDGGSQDDTLSIAEEAGAVIVQTSPSRGGQLRAGAQKAQGEWLLFLHTDTCLEPGWTDAVFQQLERQGKAGYFQLQFNVPGVAARFVAGWANLRSRLFGLPYGDQGILIARSLYHEVGGYSDIPLMEDVALARALAGRLEAMEGIAVTSADKYVSTGWMRRGGRNLWTLLRYLGGVSPERLAKDYRR